MTVLARYAASPPARGNFRHEKIWDFFIVQTFLEKNNERPEKHMGDARFRGVYLLLAMLLPVDEATALRERFVEYDTGMDDQASVLAPNRPRNGLLEHRCDDEIGACGLDGCEHSLLAGGKRDRNCVLAHQCGGHGSQQGVGQC
jgi:hypothetical protein